MFNKRQYLVRTTVASALLSALVLTQTAHAGLLGGGGGGLGGGLGGGFGSRSLDIGGNAAGQVSRDGTSLPRGQRALEKAGDAKATTTDKADEAKQSATDKASDSAATGANTARDRAGQLGGTATGSASGSAAASRNAADRSVNAGAMSQAGGAVHRSTDSPAAAPHPP